MANLTKKGTVQSLRETDTSVLPEMPKLRDAVMKSGRRDLLEFAEQYDKQMQDWQETANAALHRNFNLLET